MVYTAFPGLQSMFIESILTTQVKGIIIRGFGPGNLPIKENSLIESIKRYTQKQIPVVIESQTAIGLTKLSIYETGIVAENLGVISSEDMTFEATVTKFMWTLHQTQDLKRIRNLMRENIAGEIMPLK